MVAMTMVVVVTGTYLGSDLMKRCCKVSKSFSRISSEVKAVPLSKIIKIIIIIIIIINK